jgi:hypothetical protein
MKAFNQMNTFKAKIVFFTVLSLVVLSANATIRPSDENAFNYIETQNISLDYKNTTNFSNDEYLSLSKSYSMGRSSSSSGGSSKSWGGSKSSTTAPSKSWGGSKQTTPTKPSKALDNNSSNKSNKVINADRASSNNQLDSSKADQATYQKTKAAVKVIPNKAQVREGSELKETFDRTILKLKENGTIYGLKAKWFGTSDI